MFRLKITYKLALVLVALSAGPLMLSALLGLISVDDSSLLRLRSGLVEQVSSTISVSLDQGGSKRVEAYCNGILSGKKEVRGIRVLRFDGLPIYQSDGFMETWDLTLQGKSSRDQMSIPLRRGDREWAQIDVLFHPPVWYDIGLVRFIGFVGIALIVNAVSFVIFLNRSLSVLEPTNAVPRRVRNTLDTIAGGVVVLDGAGKIMLANESFMASLASSKDKIVGSRLSQLPWRLTENVAAPWEVVLNEKRKTEGTKIFLPTSDLHERCFVVNATPVWDGAEKLAGALISFEDITALEEQRKSLVVAMNELEASKDKIRLQNERLQELASRDALTGALNRRILYEHMDTMWNNMACQPAGMITMMMDIDHFKKLNDKHGHAAGDAVLKEVVRILHATVGEDGVVGRYGGEEFCVLMYDTSIEAGMAMGENIRQAIEMELAIPYSVTTSIGVSSSILGADSVKDLLEKADKALYAAKHSGRNQTCCWTAKIDALEEENKKRSLAIQTAAMVDDQPIPYHAVIALHSALAFRHADTAYHSQRVAELSIAIGRGLMGPNDLYFLEIAALLHDIGKIGVPDSVLMKPGRLNEEEWAMMEAHGPIGLAIAESAFDSKPISDVLKYHHCRFDGKNQDASWPSGKDIPLVARIVAIADAFDAMVSDRCYRQGRSSEEAFEELQKCAGGQFDPDLVAKFRSEKSGWRIDSRFQLDETPDRNALNIGHFMERVIHSFDSRDLVSLRQRLDKLQTCAEESGMFHIAMITSELNKDADRKTIGEWDSLLPLIDDLLEVCLTVQRAFLRHVGSSPRGVDDCASQTYLQEHSKP